MSVPDLAPDDDDDDDDDDDGQFHAVDLLREIDLILGSGSTKL